jgi:type IV pilus assembly protein PilO
MSAINRLLERLPLLMIAIIYCAYLAYDYQQWLTVPSSEFNMKKAELKQTKENLEKMKKKLDSLKEFEKNILAIKAEILQLMSQLDNAKSSLSDDVDIANFIDLISNEAKKLRLNIVKVKPEPEIKKDYYIEVPFTVEFKGAFIQVLVFFDKLARQRQIIHIQDFEMSPSGSNLTKYVELKGTIRLATYKYLGTQVDTMVTSQGLDKTQQQENNKSNEEQKNQNKNNEVDKNKKGVLFKFKEQTAYEV